MAQKRTLMAYNLVDRKVCTGQNRTIELELADLPSSAKKRDPKMHRRLLGFNLLILGTFLFGIGAWIAVSWLNSIR